MIDKKSILKRLPLGIIIIVVAAVGLKLVAFSDNGTEIYMVLSCLLLLLFGAIFIFLGFLGALFLCLNFAAVMLPEEYRGLGLVCLYGGFVVIGAVVGVINRKRAKDRLMSESMDLDASEAGLELDRINEMTEDMLSMAEIASKMDLEQGELTLIGRKFPVRNYKIFIKDGSLFFCNDVISHFEKEQWNSSMEDLLRGKKNFCLPMTSIRRIVIRYSRGKARHISGRRRLDIDLETDDKIYAFKDGGLLSGEYIVKFFADMGVLVDAPVFEDDEVEEDYAELTGDFMRVKKSVSFLNTVTSLAAMWLFFYPNPYWLVILIHCLLPIVSLYFYVKYNQWMKTDKKRTNKADISYALTVSPVVLAVVGVLVLVKMAAKASLWSIPLVREIIFLSAAIGVLISAAVLLLTSRCKGGISFRIWTVIICFAYAFGSVFHLSILLK